MLAWGVSVRNRGRALACAVVVMTSGVVTAGPAPTAPAARPSTAPPRGSFRFSLAGRIGTHGAGAAGEGDRSFAYVPLTIEGYWRSRPGVALGAVLDVPLVDLPEALGVSCHGMRGALLVSGQLSSGRLRAGLLAGLAQGAFARGTEGGKCNGTVERVAAVAFGVDTGVALTRHVGVAVRVLAAHYADPSTGAPIWARSASLHVELSFDVGR